MQTCERLSAHEIDQVKAGNVLAFETLYNKYKQPVFALCLRSTKHIADAEDLTQEVFLQVYRRISSLRNNAAFKS
jgi:RNA polymerase sigma-70 factor (ECF subfamily)